MKSQQKNLKTTNMAAINPLLSKFIPEVIKNLCNLVQPYSWDDIRLQLFQQVQILSKGC